MLQVNWLDTSTGTISGRNLQTQGELTGSGMYPSILTWGSNNNVLVVGKIDGVGTGNEPHLRVHTQDRDDMTAAPSSETVISEDAFEMSVPHLARDGVLPEQHLVWTVKDPTGIVKDDVKTRVKDASTWAAATLRDVSVTANTEDHAMIDFTYSGRRYTSYHRDQSSSNPDIWLEISTWNGTTWTVVSEFGLTDSADFDFPSIWIRNDGNTAEIAVAAHKPSTGNTAVWKCGAAAEASCDTAGEFGSYQANTTGGNRTFPEVVVVPRSNTSDTFVLVENGAANTVRILSICGGTASSFVEEGSLPVPPSHACGPDQMLSGDAAWARSQVKWDGTEFHVIHMVESCTHAGTFGIGLYSAAPGDLCP
jgi:hypothetical protein